MEHVSDARVCGRVKAWLQLPWANVQLHHSLARAITNPKLHRCTCHHGAHVCRSAGINILPKTSGGTAHWPTLYAAAPARTIEAKDVPGRGASGTGAVPAAPQLQQGGREREGERGTTSAARPVWVLRLRPGPCHGPMSVTGR